jgi:chromosome segregation ATPase
VRIEALEASAADLRTQLESARAAHQTERTRLEERHAAAEAHWLTEVDRARQSAKEQGRQAKELRGQIGRLRSEGDQLRQQLTETRSELKTATAVREQLEERLRAAARISDRALSKTKPKDSGKPRRPSRSTRAAPKRTSNS